jgi:hypothetical protein
MAVFYRNGELWMPRGVMIRAFVSSIPTAQYLLDKKDEGSTQGTIDAQRIYGSDELTAAWQTFGAKMLRFQVSQQDLDPEDDRSGACQPMTLRIEPPLSTQSNSRAASAL